MSPGKKGLGDVSHPFAIRQHLHLGSQLVGSHLLYLRLALKWLRNHCPA
jgi:hypothetical protein